MVRRTVTRSPFQSPVALAISSPTFFGERPRGPIFGASAEEAPTSPPVARRWMILISVGSTFGAGYMLECCVFEILVKISRGPQSRKARPTSVSLLRMWLSGANIAIDCALRLFHWRGSTYAYWRLVDYTVTIVESRGVDFSRL